MTHPTFMIFAYAAGYSLGVITTGFAYCNPCS